MKDNVIFYKIVFADGQLLNRYQGRIFELNVFAFLRAKREHLASCLHVEVAKKDFQVEGRNGN